MWDIYMDRLVVSVMFSTCRPGPGLNAVTLPSALSRERLPPVGLPILYDSSAGKIALGNTGDTNSAIDPG